MILAIVFAFPATQFRDRESTCSKVLLLVLEMIEHLQLFIANDWILIEETQGAYQ
jgi:hypothetical protein